MNKKIMIYITIGIIILCVVAIFTYKQINKDFQTELNNNYIITTDSQFTTLLNDGGSHINIYYEIDLEQKSIKKCEDNYIGFKGYEYKEKVIYEKEISGNLNDEIKDLLSELLSKDDINEDNNYKYYTIKSNDGNLKEIYNKDSINEIKVILNKIDEL